MDVSALSNAFFVKPVMPAGGQLDVRPTAGDRRQHRYAEVEADGPATAEGAVGVSEDCVGDEKIQFKKTLNERSPQQPEDVPENVEGQGKSDNSAADEAEKYASAGSVAVAAGLEELIAGVPTEGVQAASPALAVLTYLAQDKLVDNPGNAPEAISAVVEKMLGRQSGGETVAGAADEEAAESAGVLEKIVPQPDLASAQYHAVKVAQTAGTAETVGEEGGEQGVEKSEQQAFGGQSVVQTTQPGLPDEAEAIDPQQAGSETAAVLKKQTVAQVKTTGQSDSHVKGLQQQSAGRPTAEQVEQVTDALGGRIKNSTGKGTSRDESGGSTMLRQDKSSQAVISTDTAGDAAQKATEVFKVPQTQQSDSGKELFDKAGQQIQASISNSVRREESEVTVRLHPPELGKVLIRLQQQDGQITGLLEFSKAETKAEIQQLLPQLVRNLQDAGIAVKRLDVVQTQIDNSGGQQFKEHVAGDGTAYQQQFNQGQPGNVGLGYDWASGESIYSGAESLSESYISDGAVNILV